MSATEIAANSGAAGENLNGDGVPPRSKRDIVEAWQAGLINLALELVKKDATTFRDADELQSALMLAVERAGADGIALTYTRPPALADQKEFESAVAAVVNAALAEARESLPVKPEPPRPLRRDVGRAEPYPHLALGPLLAPAAEAVQAATQAPIAICAQSVLATANFSVQAHINVELPTGDVKPVSEYLVTVADSGERKTSADERALRTVRGREADLAEVFREEWKYYKDDLNAFQKQRAQTLANRKLATRADKRQALATLGDEPKLPRSSILLCSEPTYEGLVRLLREGHGYCGLFSSEGGMFVGGHGMSHEAKLRTITGLSAIFDGTPIKRTRGGDGNHALPGRRVALHLLMQPAVADLFFGDALLVQQGFLSRVLASAPDATAGSRPFHELEEEHFSQISHFSSRVTQILETPVPSNEKDERELRPRTVKLSLDATRLWIGFHDHIEKLIAPDAPLSPVKPLANKAPEHAARLAATIEAFGNLKVETISAKAMQWGVDLIQHYLGEALRIYGAIQDSPDLRVAEKALAWIRTQPGGVFSLPDLYQFGPHAIRDAAKARSVITILVEHRWIIQLEGGAIIDGVKRREVFALTEETKK